MHGFHRLAQAGLIGSMFVFMGRPLGAQADSELSPFDVQYLLDFTNAEQRFRSMSLSDFESEFGPGGFQFIRGDTNANGLVEIGDVICTLFFLFAGDGPCASPVSLDALDADDSGAVDISDPLYELQYLFLDGPMPSSPFPGLGEDLTKDILPDGPLNNCTLDYDPLESQYMDLITGYYPLNNEQSATFGEKGFVILKDKKYSTFIGGFAQIYGQHLPVYVSVDAILDALHISFDRMLIDLEENVLVLKLDSMLRKMEDGIGTLDHYSGGTDISDELDDVAFWIGVARSLLQGEKVACQRGMDAEVEQFLGYVDSRTMQRVTLFGVSEDGNGGPLIEDFSQFIPRGHYTRSETLERYFQTMMWVQRIGMNFVKFPRPAAVAFLLTRDLYDSGAIEEWNIMDNVVAFLVGTSDDLNPPSMVGLSDQAGIQSDGDFLDPKKFAEFSKLARDIGAGKQLINSQVLQATIGPEGFTPIPPAYHLMGQRFIVDSYVFTNVVHDRVPFRYMPSPLDAMFVLGNKVTVPLLQGELEAFQYYPTLAKLKWIVSSYKPEFWDSGLYNLWLSALRTLHSGKNSDLFPGVMCGRDWELRILQAQLASWAHLRHDTLLYAKPSYGANQCDYPDGWVDPYPEFFEKLASFAEKASSRFETLGILDIEIPPPVPVDREVPIPPFSGSALRKYLESLRDHSRVLKNIAQTELDQREFTDEGTNFMKSIVSGGGCGTPRYDGWYIDLVFNEGSSAYSQKMQPTIADVHTDPQPGNVLEVGVGSPNIMLISVKNECGLKAYVGPVLSYHEFVQGNLERLTDEEWQARLESGEEQPRPWWTANFVK